MVEETIEEREERAERATSPAELEKLLAEDEDMFVRKYAASNTNTLLPFCNSFGRHSRKVNQKLIPKLTKVFMIDNSTIG
jgi:hypothetical protein